MTSRHPAVSCACPKCQSERRTTPPHTPATDTLETYGTMTPTIEVVPPHYPLATEDREVVALVAYYARRGADDLGAGEAERLLEAAQLLAAEILAAEANERARIVASLRATSTGLDLTKRRIADAIERGEHGAGK